MVRDRTGETYTVAVSTSPRKPVVWVAALASLVAAGAVVWTAYAATIGAGTPAIVVGACIAVLAVAGAWHELYGNPKPNSPNDRPMHGSDDFPGYRG